jgi:peptide/nickel transport system permease protein
MVPNTYRGRTGLVTAVSRRLLEGAATAFAAVSFAFFALHLALGDPVASLLSQGLATPEQADALRTALGFDDPILKQYTRYIGELLRGQFGTSIYTGRPVSQIILEQLPSTLELALSGLIFGTALGMFLGIVAAWRSGKIRGRLASGCASLATALPVAFLGILALVFGSYLFPASGQALFNPLRRLLLPSLVLGAATAGPIAKVVHRGLEESLGSPFILAARARGIRENRRLLWHAFRPALPAAIALIALEAAFLFGGTVVTETVFSRPGIGRLLVQSILGGDFPVAQGIIVLSAIVYTISATLGDIAATILDPRLQVEE